MAPLLSLDTLLVVVISFYHYVNFGFQKESEKKADTSFSFSHTLSPSISMMFDATKSQDCHYEIVDLVF